MNCAPKRVDPLRDCCGRVLSKPECSSLLGRETEEVPGGDNGEKSAFSLKAYSRINNKHSNSIQWNKRD